MRHKSETNYSFLLSSFASIGMDVGEWALPGGCRYLVLRLLSVHRQLGPIVISSCKQQHSLTDQDGFFFFCTFFLKTWLDSYQFDPSQLHFYMSASTSTFTLKTYISYIPYFSLLLSLNTVTYQIPRADQA